MALRHIFSSKSIIIQPIFVSNRYFFYLCKMKKEESQLQRLCVQWFRLSYPNALIFAIPNGGSRNIIEAKNLKAEGVLAGVADLQVIDKNKTFFIEMKTKKGRQQPTQKDFEDKVKSFGFGYFVCRSFDEFQNIVKNEIKK